MIIKLFGVSNSDRDKEIESLRSELDDMNLELRRRGTEINDLQHEISIYKNYKKILERHVHKVLSELRKAKIEGRELSHYMVKRELKKIVNRRFFR